MAAVALWCRRGRDVRNCGRGVEPPSMNARTSTDAPQSAYGSDTPTTANPGALSQQLRDALALFLGASQADLHRPALLSACRLAAR